MQPFSFYTRCIVLSDLFAGKMHALQWKNRVKGRDWYDMEWYIRQGIPLHFGHLQERVKQLTDLELTREYFSELLQEKIATTDINAVRSDVIPFLNNPSETEIWSNEYFQQISKMIRFV